MGWLPNGSVNPTIVCKACFCLACLFLCSTQLTYTVHRALDRNWVDDVLNSRPAYGDTGSPKPVATLPRAPHVETIRSLRRAGVRRIVCGHKPHGDAALVVYGKDREEGEEDCARGVTIITLDTSYAASVKGESAASEDDKAIDARRARSVSELLIYSAKNGDNSKTNAIVHGSLANGDEVCPLFKIANVKAPVLCNPSTSGMRRRTCVSARGRRTGDSSAREGGQRTRKSSSLACVGGRWRTSSSMKTSCQIHSETLDHLRSLLSPCSTILVQEVFLVTDLGGTSTVPRSMPLVRVRTLTSTEVLAQHFSF